MSVINTITIKGAKEHNLKNLDLELPKNKLIVFTGLSGSGKSSLAFDTLYAEGQRRYVESLSSYARQFLGVMHKPAVDQITGLSPAISIDQKTTSHNPRSTVGTITEIYDYLRLLFAKVGTPHCVKCGQIVTAQSIDQIVKQLIDKIEMKLNGAALRMMILAPVITEQKGEFNSLFNNLKKKGYLRVRIDKQVYSLDKPLLLLKNNKHNIEVVVDRVVISKKQLRNKQKNKVIKSRLTNSLEEALKLSNGVVITSFINDSSLSFPDNPQKFDDVLFSEKRACSQCGISVEEPTPRFFSFNSPQGACSTCTGLGSLQKIDIEKIIAPTLTLSEGAVIPFARIMNHDSWWTRLVKQVVKETRYNYRKTPFEKFDKKTKQLLLFGSEKVYLVTRENKLGKQVTTQQTFEGFINNLERRYHNTESEFVKKEINSFMHHQVCPDCLGDRLKPEALSVYLDKLNIADVTKLPINKTLIWAKQLLNSDTLTKKEKNIAQSIIKEVITRLTFLDSVGLSYLSLSRQAGSLAGGEAQRIRLASQIGTGLTGVLYILDEPTIGLHPRDNHQLIHTLRNLQEKGNTVIVVEHDRDIMLSADQILDIGPKAGSFGGKIVVQGTPKEVMKNSQSLTGKYLSRKKTITRKKNQHQHQVISLDAPLAKGEIRIEQAERHNLKKIDIEFPLGKLICITGVSGSGKSTLLHDTLYLHLAKHLNKTTKKNLGKIKRITIPHEVRRVVLIDQSPIGKTPRSNPATYTKVFDYIRKLYANTKDARIRGYKVGRFSFNVKGGRCEACQGDGQIKIEMQFLPDIYVTCDVCHGKRYSQETLEVKYREKNIAQVLAMTVNEAVKFFSNHSTILNKLKTLQAVGLGYIKLGQPAPTLSGGEAQRVKLAKELAGKTLEHNIYLLDEPTTGLHFADIQKLLDILSELVAQNNTVILIEHNLDIIKNADWIIDLGPEGGERGGEVVATGTVTDIANNPNSITGKYLKEELKLSNQ